jgi:hypothetical protein
MFVIWKIIITGHHDGIILAVIPGISEFCTEVFHV